MTLNIYFQGQKHYKADSNIHIIKSKAWHTNLHIHAHPKQDHIYQDKTRSQTNARSCNGMP